MVAVIPSGSKRRSHQPSAIASTKLDHGERLSRLDRRFQYIHPLEILLIEFWIVATAKLFWSVAFRLQPQNYVDAIIKCFSSHFAEKTIVKLWWNFTACKDFKLIKDR